MKFRVINGGKAAVEAGAGATIGSAPTRDDVQAEARRRLAQSDYHRWHVREAVTGATMPSALRYLQMQINYVAEALSRLERIPEDYRSDTYWPFFETAD